MSTSFMRSSIGKSIGRLGKSFFPGASKPELKDIAPDYQSGEVVLTNDGITNRFIQTWKSSEFDLVHAQRLIDFRKANSDFVFEFSDDVTMDAYMRERWGDHPIFEVYKNLRYGAAYADVWRYCNLYDQGGVYLDIDSSILVNLREFDLSAKAIVSFEGNKMTDFLDEEHSADFEWFRARDFRQEKLDEPDRPVLNWCLFFSKEHPILKSVIESIVENAEFYNGKKFSSVQRATVNFTGPIAFTKAVWQYADAEDDFQQMGIDFEGRAQFKDVPEDSQAVYHGSLKSSYHKQKREMVFDRRVRLNLGCGGDIKKGYTNIDAVPQSDQVIAMDVRKLSYTENSVDEIYAKDVLEHLGFPDAMKALENWSKVIKSGGELFIQTISFETIVEAHRKKYWDVRALNYMLFSGVSWQDGQPTWNDEKTTEFDWHKCVFDYEYLKNTLESLGFEVVRHKFDPIDDLKKKPYKHNLNMYIWAQKK